MHATYCGLKYNLLQTSFSRHAKRSTLNFQIESTNSDFILNDGSFERNFSTKQFLTLTRPIGLPPHTPVAQKIADQRWLIANSAKKFGWLVR